MAEEEFWGELLKEVRSAASLDPQLAEKAALLLESGWTQELAAKIDIPSADPGAQAESSGMVPGTEGQEGPLRGKGTEEPPVPAVEDIGKALDLIAEAGVPALRDLMRDLDELFAAAKKLGVEL